MATNNPIKVARSVQKVFSVKEICHIIQVCHKNGVSELGLGDLRLSFGEKDRESGVVVRKKPNVPDVDEYSTSDRKELDEKTYVSVSQREFESAQMLIDDPVAFENAEIDAALGGSI